AQDPPEYLEAVRLVQQRQWTAALERVHKLNQQYPGNPKVGNLEGLALLGSGNSQRAEAVFQQVVTAHPDFFPALKNLALLEWETNEPVAAANHTAKALQINP